MAQIIAVLNDKGGVAKTTTTANLGTALWLLGKKVLLVDTDQQCNLTLIMDKTSLLPIDDGGPATLYEWFHDINRIPVFERYPGLDYIPSSRRMADASESLSQKVASEKLLQKRLAMIQDAYDYILIDCIPGGKNLVNTNVLVASDSIIVPTEASFFSVQGAPNLLHFIDEVREGYDKPLPIMGYLLVKFDRNTTLSKEVKNYYSGASNKNGGPLFPIQIRRCQRCNESPGSEMTLFEYAPSSTACDDYMRLAEHILGLKVRKKSWTPEVWGKKCKVAFAQFKATQAESVG